MNQDTPWTEPGSTGERLQRWFATGRMLALCGRRIFVATAGQGPHLVLIHGYPTSSWDWHRLWAPLARHFTLWAPDLPGMGFSDKRPDASYTLDDHADVIEALLAQVGARHCQLLAHDLGVSVAQELLARRTQSTHLPAIDAVVLLNGGLCPEAYQPRPIQRVLASALGRWIAPRLPRSAFDRSITGLFAPSRPPEPALLDMFWALVNLDQGRRITHRVGRFYIDRLARRDRLVQPLLDSRVPIRLINGMADPNSGRHMAERYRELVPDADIVWLDGVGHWPQIEAPQAVLEATLAHLLRPAAPQAGRLRGAASGPTRAAAPGARSAAARPSRS